MPYSVTNTYNQAPQSPSQTRGLTAGPINQQTISSMSAGGVPGLGLSPSGFGIIPQYQANTPNSPGSTSSSGFGSAPQYSNPPNAPGMLGTTPPSMGSFDKSSNPSTLMRTMVGNTTQSGAQNGSLGS